MGVMMKKKVNYDNLASYRPLADGGEEEGAGLSKWLQYYIGPNNLGDAQK